MARHVLDIFLSSTSEDMGDYRRTVADVLSRLGQFVVRMETFGAKPTKPLATCRAEVSQADALIVVVGHRPKLTPAAITQLLIETAHTRQTMGGSASTSSTRMQRRDPRSTHPQPRIPPALRHHPPQSGNLGNRVGNALDKARLEAHLGAQMNFLTQQALQHLPHS